MNLKKCRKEVQKKTAVKQKMRKLRLAVKSFMIQQASKNYNRRKIKRRNFRGSYRLKKNTHIIQYEDAVIQEQIAIP